jgi:hypothetical protein
MRDRYDIRSDYPEFDAVQEHHCRYLALTTDNGRYIVMTDSDGSDYPTAKSFQVCVYRDEESFYEEPTDCMMTMFSSDDGITLADAVESAEDYAESC